jgi:two-component system, NtrC family, sensor kinase
MRAAKGASKRILRDWRGYLLAIVSVALATWLKFLAQPNIIPADVPILYIVAIIPTAILFGFGPAILVCILSLLAYDYFFIPPLQQINFLDIRNAPLLLIFLLVGILFSYLAANLRNKNKEALKEIAARKQSEAELEQYRDHLEELVRQRTVELEKANADLKQDIVERRKAETALQQSEQRWATTLASIGDAVIATDTAGRITFMNPVAESLTGWCLHEASAKPIAEVFDIINEYTRQKADNPVAKVIEQGIVVGLANHTILIRKDGTEFFIGDSGAPINTEKGDITGVVLVFRDISEERKANEAVEASEIRYRRLFESAKDGILILEFHDGRITAANPFLKDLLGYDQDELLGKQLWEIGAFKDILANKEAFLELQEEGYIRYDDLPLESKDGRRINVEFVSNVYSIDHTKVIQCNIRDITERKKTENALKASERYNSSLLMNSPNPIVVMEPDFSIRYVNKAFEDVTGYNSAEALRLKPPFPWWKPEHHTQYNAQYQESSGKGFSKQERLIQKKSGEDLWIELDLKPIIENDELRYYLSMWVDKTERKQSEERLLQSEKKYSTLVEKGNDGVIIIQDDLLKFVNSRIIQSTGFSKEELLGKPILEFISPAYRSFITDLYKKRLAGEKTPDSYEIEILAKDGSSIPVETGASFIEYEGKPADMAILRDITLRKQMQAQLMMTDRLATIGELAAGIAHELNNPLTSVIGFSQLIMEGEIPSEIKEDLRAVNGEAQRAAGIVKNLLTFARKHTPVKQLNQINDCLNEVLALRAYEHKNHNIKVDTHLDTNLPMSMFDYFQIQQVFINLIINAEYFMMQAHNGGSLTITTKKSEGIIRISIADDGPGISQENLKHLFNPFFTTKEVGKGTGLGLSICHGIVSEHGGRIYSRSEIGKGATFIIEMPVQTN